MSGDANYAVPDGPLMLAGPIARPAPGTLPLRGDLAHIALAGTHLAAHYVIPSDHVVTAPEAAMHLASRDDSEVIETLRQGTHVEVLDIAGHWAWVCLGPEGPSGYVATDAITPARA